MLFYDRYSKNGNSCYCVFISTTLCDKLKTHARTQCGIINVYDSCDKISKSLEINTYVRSLFVKFFSEVKKRITCIEYKGDFIIHIHLILPRYSYVWIQYLSNLSVLIRRIVSVFNVIKTFFFFWSLWIVLLFQLFRVFIYIPFRNWNHIYLL